jgi:propionate CoA-transferase
VEARVRPLGRKVAAVINYDHATIADDVLDAYARMCVHMESTWYTQISRYTSDAFELMKLGKSVLQSVPTRICATQDEACATLRPAGTASPGSAFTEMPQ